MMTRRFAAATALVTVLLAGGCARDAGSPAPDSPAAPPATTAPSDPAPSDPAPLDPAPSGKAPSGPAPGGAVGQTVTGTVSAGVEPNCLLLTGNGTSYLLVIDDPALRDQAKVGAEVTVVGRADQGMMTTCQEGTPFVVSAVRPN